MLVKLSFEKRYFGGELALRPVARAHAYFLAGVQLSYAAAPERFHMDEDVWPALAFGNEAIAFAAVEPFNGGFEGRSLRLRDETRFVCCAHGWCCRAVVEFEEAQRLETFGPHHRFADHMGAFKGGLNPDWRMQD